MLNADVCECLKIVIIVVNYARLNEDKDASEYNDPTEGYMLIMNTEDVLNYGVMFGESKLLMQLQTRSK